MSLRTTGSRKGGDGERGEKPGFPWTDVPGTSGKAPVE